MLLLVSVPHAAHNLRSNGLHNLSMDWLSALLPFFPLFSSLKRYPYVLRKKTNGNSMPVLKDFHSVFVKSGWVADIDAGGG